MGAIFLIGAVQAFFFISLILVKKQKQIADKVLMTWLFVMALHLLSYYPYYTGKFMESSLGIIVLLLPPLIYAHGPLLLIYLNVLTQKKQTLRPIQLLHFIPMLASLVFYLMIYIYDAKGDMSYFKQRPQVNNYLLMTFYLLNIFLNPVYVVIVLIKLSEHRRRIRNNFSNLENINLNWLRLLAIGLGSVSIIVWIVHSLSKLNLVDIEFDRDFYIFTSIAIFVFITGFFGFKQGIIYSFNQEPVQKDIVNSEQEKEEKPATNLLKTENTKYEKSQLPKELVDDVIKNLQEYINLEKPFRQNKLSLQEVALKLDVSPHMLSQILNVFLKTNFYNYINNFRVDEVKEMLTQKKFEHYSLLGIAYEAGFNSKSAFNRIFKNVTGQTPTQYKNSISTPAD